MPEQSVTFKVVPGAGIQGYWLQVGAETVTLVNGTGSISLDAPGTHVLIWWMKGNPGSKIGIEGKSGGASVVKVKESKIPAGENEGAGVRRFDLT